ncbi:MAG: TonB-dependent receptor [Bacteroidales bacterium]|nr:TonB-dependent receptor [Bacteroidales bacterium]
MKKLFSFSLFVALVFSFCIDAVAQNKAKVNVSGQIFAVSISDANDKYPVPFAAIILPEINVTATSDAEGVYSLPNMVEGKYKISIQSMGFVTIDTVIYVSASRDVFNFTMHESNFRMDEIVVTAEISKAGSATSSIINKNAMEHMQTTSLADIMSLMPGASQQKPDLQGVSTASVRGGSSLGTAVIVDGAPMSNNSNMQTLRTGKSSETGSVNPTTGIDLRTITTDNVESIEVIRGVAPVEYGDITAGAVIVNAKAGFQPLTLKFNVNPNVYSISATQGFALGKKAGNINYAADYAYSVDDPKASHDYYQRATAKVGYTNTFGRFYTNNALSFIYSYDRGYPNPLDEDDYQTFYQQDFGIRLAHNGQFNANAGFFKSLQYNVTFNYTNRHSFFEDNLTNADVPYSYSKVDGSVMSSYLNGHIYDFDGKEITNYDPNLTEYDRAWMLPATYWNHYDIYGKELNTFAKVKANFAGDWGKTNHRLVIGADFKSDGNVGDGTVFDYENPPYRSAGATFETTRMRNFKEIPFINQIGAYIQETFSVDIAKRKLELVAGLRYDQVITSTTEQYNESLAYGGLSPRINMSYELIPRVLNIHAAYGITRKAPTLYYLFPESKYYDMVNYNNAASSTIPDNQKMQLVTTYVQDRNVDELEMMKQTKYEVGLSANIGKMYFSVVGYQEVVDNGFGFYTDPEDYRLVDYVQYKHYFDTENGGLMTHANGTPLLEEYARNAYFVSVTNPGNRSRSRRTGLEYVFNFGRIDAIRTTFQVDGQLYTSKTLPEAGYSACRRISNSGDYSTYPDIGFFDNVDVSGVNYTEYLSTNVTAVHNIPQIGLVISANAHIRWRSHSWTKYTDDRDLLTIPKKWMPRTDSQVDGVEYKAGVLYDFNKEWANPENPNYNRFRYIIATDSYDWDTFYLRQRVYEPNLTIGINITKEFGDNFDISFFAQNMFRSSRLQESATDPGSLIRTGGGGFFFGLQLNATIK